MKKFKVCVVTGTRAEFGIWRPVLGAMRGSKVLVPQLLVTGMHLLKAFGRTVNEIEASEFAIAARAEMYRGGEGSHVSLARGIKNMGDAMVRLRPDMVLLLGDRLEMLAAASAAVALRIPIGHLHGGESAQGIWDEQIRHAVTKMAHVHFCATGVAARRIRRMGEAADSIHLVGAPAIDLAADAYRAFGGGLRDGRAILLLHPAGESDVVEEKRAALLLGLLRKHGINVEVIGPNNDPGHRGILRAYRRAGVPVLMSLSQEDFWGRMAKARLLIGNSSAGIIEAASFGVPVVNVGERQAGRERNGNVIDIGWRGGDISGVIAKALWNKRYLAEVKKRRNIYGDGKAGSRIVGILEKIMRSGVALGKNFQD